MKKRNIILSVIGFLSIFLLTGCFSKKAISTNEFRNKASNYNFEVVDVAGQYADYGYVKEATVAKSSNNWQVEFYVLSTNDNAKNMFELNKTTFEESINTSSKHSSASIGNYSTYSLTTENNFMYICRIDNTLIYLNIPKGYEKQAQTFIKDLGY